jgi:cation:H+ antiporter
MLTHPVVLFVVGGAALVAGAEFLVRGASRLAVAAGLSPLVVGLTVVAFGTSAPEMAVTVGSAYVGEAEVALGNVVGSNIFNVLFILGVSALIAPLVVAQQLIRFDVPLMIGVSVAALLLGLDGRYGRVDGAVLSAGIVAYTVFLIRQSRRETAEIRAEYDDAFGDKPGASKTPMLLNLALIVAGLVMLVLGSQWFVGAAVQTATILGVSELVIGLTIVALGTSLPELATSVLAAIRGERDIAVGNVVGSNVFNILLVLGLGGLVAPEGLPVPDGALTFDLPIMIAVAIACLPVFFTGYTIARWEGAVFVAYYVTYVTYLVLDAVDHGAVMQLGTAMIWFVLPLTVLTLVVSVLRHQRAARATTP